MANDPNNIVHLEFGVNDLLEAKKFYSHVLHWKMDLSDELPDYMFVEYDENNPDLSLGISLNDNPKNGSIVFYVRVNDIDPVLSQILDYGGKLILTKTPLPGNRGFIGRFEDPFGNIIGIWSRE